MTRRNRPFALPLALSAMTALMAVAILTSCDQSPSSTLLDPPGGDNDGSSFSSVYTAIQVVGGFNNWDDTTPSMDFNDSTGQWVDTLTVQAGCL